MVWYFTDLWSVKYHTISNSLWRNCVIILKRKTADHSTVDNQQLPDHSFIWSERCKRSFNISENSKIILTRRVLFIWFSMELFYTDSWCQYCDWNQQQTCSHSIYPIVFSLWQGIFLLCLQTCIQTYKYRLCNVSRCHLT